MSLLPINRKGEPEPEPVTAPDLPPIDSDPDPRRAGARRAHETYRYYGQRIAACQHAVEATCRSCNERKIIRRKLLIANSFWWHRLGLPE